MADRRNRNCEFGYMHQSTSSPKVVRSVLPQPGWLSLKAVIKAGACGCFAEQTSVLCYLLISQVQKLATSARQKKCCSPSFLPWKLKADEMPNLAPQCILVAME